MLFEDTCLTAVTVTTKMSGATLVHGLTGVFTQNFQPQSKSKRESYAYNTTVTSNEEASQ
jgi:hypothetical protein